MNIKIAVLAVLSLAAAGAGAQTINWNADVASQFRRAEGASFAEPRAVVAAEKSRKPAPAAPVVSFEGRPYGDNALRYGRDEYGDQITLLLNNDQTRVGAEFQNCRSSGSGDEPWDCERLQFVFDQLTTDKAAKRIKLGDEIVGKWGNWSGVQLEKGWKFRAAREKYPVDYGFDRGTVTRVRIFLERFEVVKR